ncbi:hypothetical protein [Streptomyces chromofuscus]|uniref:Uncharacterized protein n=1 Tax=Streptomyces chromofuscus TaxID=42881 RepID=A0A7M2T7A7_STRCW|nr:hypothetical protein [Streptomyces chromofuscus]QOV43785.1 hypothetical protein IPT68_29505 [Streptomyces chromofuscus]GGT21892.1 hypothetical protein GCM10010254_48110 [Streptomyces chromofuscus]
MRPAAPATPTAKRVANVALLVCLLIVAALAFVSTFPAALAAAYCWAAQPASAVAVADYKKELGME